MLVIYLYCWLVVVRYFVLLLFIGCDLFIFIDIHLLLVMYLYCWLSVAIDLCLLFIIDCYLFIVIVCY